MAASLAVTLIASLFQRGVVFALKSAGTRDLKDILT